MKISKGKTVAITYTLTLENGETIDSNVNGDPLVYSHGDNQLVAGLERALEGLRAGDRTEVSLQPEDGYGEIDTEAVLEIPRSHLPEDAWTIGARLVAEGPEGQQIHGVIASLGEAAAMVDFNHPLAGAVLHFDVTILSVA